MRLPLGDYCKFLTDAVVHYEKSAPLVSGYLDELYIRIGEKPDDVRLSELAAVSALLDGGQWEQPNYAANRIYKLACRLGRDVTGWAGF